MVISLENVGVVGFSWRCFFSTLVNVIVCTANRCNFATTVRLGGVVIA